MGMRSYLKRYLIEIGIGCDLHGGDNTKACLKAVKNAMSHCCMAGIHDILGIGHVKGALVLKVKLSCPEPKTVDTDKIADYLAHYQTTIEVEKGGSHEEGLYVEALGQGNTIMIAIAVITVYVPTHLINNQQNRRGNGQI